MTIFYKSIEYKIKQIQSLMDEYATKEDGDFKGSFLELIFYDLFNSLLPEHCFMCRGWIINKQGVRTNERDILICDKSKAPSFFLSTESGIIPEIAIKYDIQVKSCMTESKIENVVKMFTQIPTEYARRNVLLSFKNEIGKTDYLELMCDRVGLFYKQPIINILVSMSHGYYFHTVENVTLKTLFSLDDLKEIILKEHKVRLDQQDIADGRVWINDVNINDLLQKKIRLSKWMGVKVGSPICHLSPLHVFTLGLVNTLYESRIGDYFSDGDYPFSVFTYTMEFEGEEILNFKDFSGNTTGLSVKPKLRLTDSKDSPYKLSATYTPTTIGKT